MSPKQKSMLGQLLDISTEQLIDVVTVYIDLITPFTSDKIPEIKATLSIKGWKPEFNDRRFILKVDRFSDDVCLIMLPVNVEELDKSITWFKIFFGGDTWQSPEWVKYIQDLISGSS
ncbi:MAG: hypothetical protein ABSA23_15580 [Anaerolineales bacterium]